VLRDDFGPHSDIDVLVEFEPGHVPGLIRLAGMQLELADVCHILSTTRCLDELSETGRWRTLCGHCPVGQPLPFGKDKALDRVKDKALDRVKDKALDRVKDKALDRVKDKALDRVKDKGYRVRYVRLDSKIKRMAG
jgi:hypothetical protein